MKVVITRSREDSKLFSAELKKKNIDSFVFPCIEFVEPTDSYKALDREIRKNHLYDWIFFLSKNAADAFFSRLLEIGGHFFNLSPHLKIAAIGTSTASFIKEQVAFPVDFIPTKYDSKTFAREFVEKYFDPKFLIGADKQKILLVRAELDDKEFERIIFCSGQFEITTVHGYKTEIPSNSNLNGLRELLEDEDLVFLSFASSQTVKNFKILIADTNLSFYENLRILSIGPKTSQTIKESFSSLDLDKILIEAASPSFDSMIEKIKHEKIAC